MVDMELTIFVANLKTFTITRLIDARTLQRSLPKLKPLDRIVRLFHVNPVSRRLLLVLADPSLLPVVDFSSKQPKVEWTLPYMQDCGTPLCVTSDLDKLLVVYDSNKITVFNLLNQRLHEWTKQHIDRMPANFLNRYNRMVGCVSVSDSKFVLYTNYTYCVLDLNAPVPIEVEIVQNHPGKCIEGKQFNAQGWFDNLKLSQAKYLTAAAPTEN